MKKLLVLIGLLLAAAGALALAFTPDILSLIIIGLMCLILLLGFGFGMTPTLLYVDGLRTARANIEGLRDVSASTPWVALQQLEYFFHQKTLDGLFELYRAKVSEQQKNDQIVSDIEDTINEEALALRSWQSVVSQIPGTMTALGLLGTFLGLVLGISSISFSSVDATILSIQTVLRGIDVAFYTSIVGVIFSILFNLFYKLLWNLLVRELGLFVESFHLYILPNTAEQTRLRRGKEIQLILERLDRLPKKQGYMPAAAAAASLDPGNELRMMPEIREGLKNGEFIFYIQPICDLNTRAVIGGEALMRWEHGEFGLVPLDDFIPVVEANGFITKLDQYIWESVCKTIRGWIDAGLRPVPISINISKTDLMAIDLIQFFKDLVHKYRIPPRYLELEMAENAYLQCEEAARDVGDALRQVGFRLTIDGCRDDFMGLMALKDSKTDAFKLDLRYFSDESRRGAEKLQAALDQARKFHLPVIASGIENSEQMTVLRRAGCTAGQGYYLHKPMSLQEFEKLVKL